MVLLLVILNTASFWETPENTLSSRPDQKTREFRPPSLLPARSIQDQELQGTQYSLSRHGLGCNSDIQRKPLNSLTCAKGGRDRREKDERFTANSAHSAVNRCHFFAAVMLIFVAEVSAINYVGAWNQLS